MGEWFCRADFAPRRLWVGLPFAWGFPGKWQRVLFPGRAKGAGIAPGPLGSALVFRDVLVEVHEDAGSLGTGGGALGVDGAVIVAVDECVAVGPGTGEFTEITYLLSEKRIEFVLM